MLGIAHRAYKLKMVSMNYDYYDFKYTHYSCVLMFVNALFALTSGKNQRKKTTTTEQFAINKLSRILECLRQEVQLYKALLIEKVYAQITTKIMYPMSEG